MKWLIVPLALSTLAGCARDDTRYPSLAPRAIERIGFDEPKAPAPSPVTADPVLDARLAKSGGELDRIATGFAADAARAEAAAGAAGSRTVGSDAWIAAETALAQLDDWRAQASSLATDLEQLGGERAATLAPLYPPLEALRTRAATEAENEAKRIAAIGARLPSP